MSPSRLRLTAAAGLIWLDYPGSKTFNGLGNLVVDEEVALLFVDFERGSTVTCQAPPRWTGLPQAGQETTATRAARCAIHPSQVMGSCRCSPSPSVRASAHR